MLVLRNFGLLVGGETIEEAFWLARNVMTGVDTQVTLCLYVCLSVTAVLPAMCVFAKLLYNFNEWN